MQNMDVKGRGGRYSWRQPIWICVALEPNNSVLNDEMIEWTLVSASWKMTAHSSSQLLPPQLSLAPFFLLFFSVCVNHISDAKKKTLLSYINSYINYKIYCIHCGSKSTATLNLLISLWFQANVLVWVKNLKLASVPALFWSEYYHGCDVGEGTRLQAEGWRSSHHDSIQHNSTTSRVILLLYDSSTNFNLAWWTVTQKKRWPVGSFINVLASAEHTVTMLYYLPGTPTAKDRWVSM